MVDLRHKYILDMLEEYDRGCACTIGIGPENCPECVAAFIENLRLFVQKNGL